MDLGTALLRQPDLPGSGVLTLASQLRYSGLRGSLDVSGIAARTAEDLFTGQAIVSGSIYAPQSHQWRWELAASATAFGVSAAPATLGWQLLAREHLALGPGGLFAGGGAGQTQRDSERLPFVVGQVGGFRRLDPLGADELSAAVGVTSARTRHLIEGQAIEGENPFTTTYGDLHAYWSHRRGRAELLAGAGVRAGINRREPWTTWGAGTATIWMTPRMGVGVSAGRALADVVRGVPTVRYVSVALRFAFHDRAGIGRSRPPLSPNGQIGRIDVRRADDGLRIVTVYAPDASTVEIMADFTEWEPVALTRDTTARGAWTLVRPLVAGTHRVTLRIDGAAWIVPPNLPQVADEFGGAVGLLTVP